jgi:hypothetical protein
MQPARLPPQSVACSRHGCRYRKCFPKSDARTHRTPKALVQNLLRTSPHRPHGLECGVGRGLGVALGVAVGVGEGVTLGVTVGVGVGVGVSVGVGVGVPPWPGAWIATVIGEPVLKKPTVALVVCGAWSASNRKL